MSPQQLKQECINNITLQAEHSNNDLKFIKAEIDRLEKGVVKECIFWVKDWWAEGMPYGLMGIIKRLNKLYERKS